MPKLGKNDIALTAKFDCDRFLRFRLANQVELNDFERTHNKKLRDYSNAAKARPGIELVQNAGNRWEIDKYEDLIRVAGEDQVVFEREDALDEILQRTKFREVENLFEVLNQDDPPLAVIEGSFEIPTSITPSLQEAYDRYGLKRVRARPDILWIRPIPNARAGGPYFDIHIIDVKMAAKPSIRHYVEVTFYALALEEAIKLNSDLNARYRVHPQGFVWPGTHDATDFLNRFQEAQARGDTDAVTVALEATLERVPYETYHAHVIDFFENRLLTVLSQPLTQTNWHVSISCQLCDFIIFCAEQANVNQHLCQITGITAGSVQLLNQQAIDTTPELITAITTDNKGWQACKGPEPTDTSRARSLIGKISSTCAQICGRTTD